jgi:hypothetical protein
MKSIYNSGNCAAIELQVNLLINIAIDQNQSSSIQQSAFDEYSIIKDKEFNCVIGK